MKIYVALENIRSLFNVGAIFRTCSFFGVENVILVGYTAKDLNGKLHTKVTKSSLGSENDLNIVFLDDSEHLLEFARKNNLDVYCIEQAVGSIDLNNWKPQKDSIIVFGNEVTGISTQLLLKAKNVIEISRKGKHKSLNIATCVGIVLNALC